MGQVLETGKERDGRNIHNRTRSLLNHVGHNKFRAMKDALQVDVLHGVPMFFCHFQEGLPGIDSGVINQDIDASKAGNGILNNFRHIVALAGVGFKAKRRAAFRLQSRCDLFDLGPIQVGKKYMGSILCK